MLHCHGSGSGLLALVTAVAWILSLAWELPTTTGEAKKKGRRKKEEEKGSITQSFSNFLTGERA